MGEKKKRNKNIQIGKEIKLSLFTDDLLYRRNSLKTVRTNKCSKVAGFERYKNQLYFFTLAMNNIKIKLRK